MKTANIEFTTDSINFVIHACARAGELEKAEEYMFFMEREGLAMDIVSFNSVMNACASRGDLARAQFWFDNMVSRGIRPTAITFGTICKVLARHGEAVKIEDLLVAIEASGMELNEYFYAALIWACMACVPADVVRAERALERMYARGFIVRRARYPLLRTLGKEQATMMIARVVGSSHSKAERKSTLRDP
jgi:pentatricopeptide repeat protein